MIHIKIKRLLPSLRPRKRYLVYEIISEKPVKEHSFVQRQLWQDCHRFLGDYGISKLNLRFLSDKYKPKTQRGILRISHTGITMVKAALLFVQKIENEPVIMRSIAVSGTLKKASSFLGG